MEALVKKFKRMTTAQLLSKKGKSKGEELEAIETVLSLRNQSVNEEVVEKDEELPEMVSYKIDGRAIIEENVPDLKIDEILDSHKVVKKEKVKKEKTEKPLKGETKTFKIKELFAAGKSKAEIAKELDVRSQMVYNVLRESK